MTDEKNTDEMPAEAAEQQAEDTAKDEKPKKKRGRPRKSAAKPKEIKIEVNVSDALGQIIPLEQMLPDKLHIVPLNGRPIRRGRFYRRGAGKERRGRADVRRPA